MKTFVTPIYGSPYPNVSTMHCEGSTKALHLLLEASALLSWFELKDVRYTARMAQRGIEVSKSFPIVLLSLSVALIACLAGEVATPNSPTDSPSVPNQPTVVDLTLGTSRIPMNATWQIQYSGEMDYGLEVDVYNLDLFDTDQSVISDLQRRGIFVMCYFSAGSYEDWREDAAQFPKEVLGSPMEGWEGETWLDIRQIDRLGSIMGARLDVAVQKGCDGVDPDNINGYENDTGFPLKPADQIAFNIFLADEAHARGLLIGLKNDLNQIPELLPYFDWALNEQCFFFNECDLLLPFVEAGKPVFLIEYELAPEEFCSNAREMNFSALHKNLELDAYRVSCN